MRANIWPWGKPRSEVLPEIFPDDVMLPLRRMVRGLNMSCPGWEEVRVIRDQTGAIDIALRWPQRLAQDNIEDMECA